jgi:hypothetical protein
MKAWRIRAVCAVRTARLARGRARRRRLTVRFLLAGFAAPVRFAPAVCLPLLLPLPAAAAPGLCAACLCVRALD